MSLDIEPGEFLTLVGPSGCGKSTLLRILSGLEEPTSGTVEIDGKDVTKTRPSLRNLAMVFQSYALYPHLTVAENMLTPLKMRDLDRMERLPLVGPLLSRSKRRDLMDQVSATANTLRISDLLSRKPGQLSGGQRQRVALGRAMVRRPVAFLMDEPLSNLDAALRVHMRAELSALHKMLNTTFVYVTHDQAEALTMSSRIAVMMGGDLLQVGTSDQVYSQPTNLKVAEFIGSPKINILPGEVGKTGTLTVFGQEVGVSCVTHGPVSVGIRSEHLALTSPQQAVFSGTETYRENLGSDVFVHVAVSDGQHRVVLRLSPAQASSIRSGDAIHIAMDPAHVLVFDKHENRSSATLARSHEVPA
nr:ABC transporter ATP-binding protein [Thalassovita taeanensis]